jgi:uncharacterized protein (DUF952 family)
MGVSVRSLQPLTDSHGREVLVLEGPVLATGSHHYRPGPGSGSVVPVMPHVEGIFHIATPDDAERLRGDGVLRPVSLLDEGFVHCSTAEQVVATTARYFKQDAELVLIEIDVGAVEGLIRWPEVYPGQHFPHLHGPVHLTAVVAVHPWGPTEREAWPHR